MDQYKKKEPSLTGVGRKKLFLTRKLIYALVISAGTILFFVLVLKFEFLGHRLHGLSETVNNQGTRLDQQRRNITSLENQVRTLEERLKADEEAIEQNLKYLFQLKENLTLYCAKSIAKLEKKVTNSSFMVELHKRKMKRHLADINQAIKNLQNKSNLVFKYCQYSTDSCKIGSRGDGAYWRACRTTFLPIEEPVSLDSKC